VSAWRPNKCGATYEAVDELPDRVCLICGDSPGKHDHEEPVPLRVRVCELCAFKMPDFQALQFCNSWLCAICYEDVFTIATQLDPFAWPLKSPRVRAYLAIEIELAQHERETPHLQVLNADEHGTTFIQKRATMTVIKGGRDE